MSRSIPALALVLVLSLSGSAADKVDVKKPIGTWQRESDGRTLTFAIKSDSLTITLAKGEAKIVATAAYGVTSEGVLYGIITKVDAKDQEGGPVKGDLFSFQFTTNKTEMTLSDLNGTKVSEHSRKLVEGVYSAKKD